MKQKHLLLWVTAAGVVGIAFAVFYTILGLKGLPVYQKFVPAADYEGWSRGLYGAAFVGFSVLLLFVGRRVVQTKDRELARILMLGIGSWLLFEAVISLIYGVYINVAVDVAIMAFLSLPLLKATRKQ